MSGTGVSTALQTEWPLIAHEIGHNFGAIHDCTSGCSLSDSCCPYSQSSCSASGRFIMNPTTNSVETQFSGCTLGNICESQVPPADMTYPVQRGGQAMGDFPFARERLSWY